MLVGCAVDEVALATSRPDYTEINTTIEAIRVLHRISSAIRTEKQHVAVGTTDRAALLVAEACVTWADKTYRSNAAIPVLLAIATAATTAVQDVQESAA
jgi:hypothetical protein